MKQNKNKQEKKEKHKEKKQKKIKSIYKGEFNDDNNEINTDNEEKKLSIKEDKNWTKMLEEQMNKYDVESSSY